MKVMKKRTHEILASLLAVGLLALAHSAVAAPADEPVIRISTNDY